MTGHTVQRLERVRPGAFLPRISGFSKRNVRMLHKKDFVVELDLGWSLFPKTAVIYDSRRVFGCHLQSEITFIKGRRQKVLLGDGKGFGPRMLLILQKISFQIFET